MAPCAVEANAWPVVLLLLAVAAGVSTADGHGCIQRVDEVGVPGSCLCYDKCARDDGGEGFSLRDALAQTCFVDCVLRIGCVCPDDGSASGGAPAASPPKPPPAPKPPAHQPGLPAVLDKTVTVRVTRPKVSRSRKEEELYEMVRIELTFKPQVQSPRVGATFTVHVNEPDGRVGTSQEGTYSTAAILSDEELATGKAVKHAVIGERLEQIGADGDRTILVSIVPIDWAD